MTETEKKEIEEMARDLQDCIDYDEWAAREYGETYVDYDSTALNMVKLGYRKQSEGEWVRRYSDNTDHLGKFKKYDGDFCSICGVLGSGNYCPNCGAKMKGGE